MHEFGAIFLDFGTSAVPAEWQSVEFFFRWLLLTGRLIRISNELIILFENLIYFELGLSDSTGDLYRLVKGVSSPKEARYIRCVCVGGGGERTRRRRNSLPESVI
jgi:hypothetical protein